MELPRQDDFILSLCSSMKATLIGELAAIVNVNTTSQPDASGDDFRRLQPGYSLSDLYLQTSKWFPSSTSLLAAYGVVDATAEELSPAEAQRLEQLMEKDKLRGIEKQAVVVRPPSKSSKQRMGREQRSKTAGKEWYDLPLQDPTPEMKQELQVLRLRSFADPKKFYKKGDRELPKHFEVGTVISPATDFYSKDRPGKAPKGSTLGLVDELLRDQQYRKFAKRKYKEIQEKRSGAGRRRKRVKL